jgi:hypothetical protein
VLAKCSEAMRNAAAPVDTKALLELTRTRGKPRGSYGGGLVRVQSPQLLFY